MIDFSRRLWTWDRSTSIGRKDYLVFSVDKNNNCVVTLDGLDFCNHSTVASKSFLQSFCNTHCTENRIHNQNKTLKGLRVFCCTGTKLHCHLGLESLFTLFVDCFIVGFGLSHLKFDNFFEYTKRKSTRANHSYKLRMMPRVGMLTDINTPSATIKSWNDLPT